MSDTTLSSLFPSVPVLVGGERLCLRPIILRELPAVERVLEGWRLLVATGGNFAQAEAWQDVLDLTAASVGRSRPWLDQLSEADFEALICQVMSINEEIWRPRPAAKDEGKAFTWSQIVQCLVEHGHPFDAIQGYTLAQARTLLTECFRQESEAMARDIQSAAFSMASSESVDKAVKGLRRG